MVKFWDNIIDSKKFLQHYRLQKVQYIKTTTPVFSLCLAITSYSGGCAEVFYYSAGDQEPDEGGAGADHVAGDGANRVAPRGHQVPPQRALPRRPRVRQPTHVTSGPSSLFPCRWQGHDEVLSQVNLESFKYC